MKCFLDKKFTPVNCLNVTCNWAIHFQILNHWRLFVASAFKLFANNRNSLITEHVYKIFTLLILCNSPLNVCKLDVNRLEFGFKYNQFIQGLYLKTIYLEAPSSIELLHLPREI